MVTPHSSMETPDAKPSDALPVSEDLMRQYEQVLGALTIRVSYFHFILEKELWLRLGLDDEAGRVLTENLQLANLVDRLQRVLR